MWLTRRRGSGRKRLDPAGRVALVTGGARGIGLETARQLRAHGASVALVDIDPGAAAAAAEDLEGDRDVSGASRTGRAIGIGADVGDAAAVDAAVEVVEAELGPVEICVTAAGIASHASTIRAMDPGAFEQVVDVNLLGTWRTVRAVLPSVTRHGGHIVLVSSIYAFTNGAFVGPYACSKAAVEQLGRALRIELAQHRATCGVAYFGFVDTEMVRQGFESDELGRRLEQLVPGVLRPRITAAEAGETIVDGLERRRPRTIAPRSWMPMSLLRGVLGPLSDRALSRHGGLQALAREADREGRLAPGETVTQAAASPGDPLYVGSSAPEGTAVNPSDSLPSHGSPSKSEYRTHD